MAIRSQVPRESGVYLFRDRSGAPLYVGKSVNLRQRMLSYFGSDLTRLETRIRQMAFAVRSFEFRVTASELMALLLENALIKQERPVFNVRQQEYEQYRYVVLTDDPYPTCKIVDHQESMDGRVFGPFRDRYLAADIVDIVNRYFRLRWCGDAQPFRKSLNFDLGFCTRPCRNRISVEDYAQIVGRVLRFLNGDEEWVADRLEREMTRSASNRDYEKAAEFKRKLAFCGNFCARQRFIHGFSSTTLTVRHEGKERLEYRFENGDLVRVVPIGGTKSGGVSVPEEVLVSQRDPRFLLDKASLVYSWLKQNRMTCRYAFEPKLPPDPALEV
jgi:excinuclease UvrABC nuclease subunit